MALIEVKVPDIGDFRDVPVIEIAVKAGDMVKEEDTLVTLESDKATMDVPSPAAGTVKELRLKVSDKVSEGSVVLLLESGEQQSAISDQLSASSEQQSAISRQPSAISDQPSASGEREAAAGAPAIGRGHDIDCELLVLGAGPGGYSAAFRAADLGLKTVLVERYPTLGGVCLNVGCVPSKALLHVAAVMEEAARIGGAGVAYDPPRIDLDRLRAHKDKVVAKLTQGLAGMAKARKVEVVRGNGRFVDANHVEVALTQGEGRQAAGGSKLVRFGKCIIAAGSSAVRLPFLPEDPRIVDSTGALALPFAPKRMLVIGGGIIGLEMATVYAALGAQVDIVEMLDGLMQGPDRDLVKAWEKQNARRFGRVMLGTRVARAEAQKKAVRVWFEGSQAPEAPQDYELVLQSAGRVPNGGALNAAAAGVAVDARGFIAVDAQMRTGVPHIFAIGDIVGQPMLAHKAVHEGHVAAEAAAGLKSFFDARVIPAVAYTDPEVAWVGLGEDAAKAQGIAVGSGRFPWAASGRAIANGAEYGFTKLVFDAETRRVVGGAIVGPNAGDMIGEIALAIEMGADAEDIGRTIHPHPTLGETIGLAAEAHEGTCTDLMPPRKP
ncbi:MAG TPA: dihydrolipoyl dehydrogenase [Candidatus Desulfobacillus sp.]|nr:dihydrolipoyl dehydrogenase [Candidatus Desulfobacillus sp.]